MRAEALRCQDLVAPLGVTASTPVLSWRWAAPVTSRGAAQTAFRVLVASTPSLLRAEQGDVWDSGVVATDQCRVRCGAALDERTDYYWKVRGWDHAGRPTPWSAIASWSTGICDTGWTAQWIGDRDAASPTAAPARPATWLRRHVFLDAPVRRAIAHVASIGYHELHCNGAKVGDAVLTPSVSDLGERARVTSHDLTRSLVPGHNTIGLWLSAGWAAHERFAVPAAPLVRAEIDIEDARGRWRRVTTDAQWRVRPSNTAHAGPWRFGSYGGERVDAGAAQPEWCTTESPAAGWGPASVYSVDLELVSDALEPNRCVERIEPARIEQLADGAVRVDFGRGFTGWHTVTLHGDPNATVSLHTSEREDQRETYGQRSELVLDADGKGTFRHRFNYACGRWLTIVGASRPPLPDEVHGMLVRNAYRRTGHFACGDAALERLHRVVLDTFESLTLGGYVVDCAHRERWGYGGDAHATMDTALTHYDLRAFYRKWIDDWRAIQDETGNLPHTCPTYDGGGGPAWSGICVMLPWELYRRTGDLQVLADTYPTMRRWLAFLDRQCVDDILHKYHDERYTAAKWSFLGDWVPPGAQQGGGTDDEDTKFFNNAYRLWNLRTVAAVAAALDRTEDARQWRRRAEEVRAAVHERFFDTDRGAYASGRQTTWALALLAEVAPPPLRPELVRRLERAITVEHHGHLDTGIHGTWMLIRALMAADRNDLIHRIATQTDYPGWGYMLAQGATTIWEQWDGVHSRLHSSFLSIGAWFIEGLAGIRPGAPGSGQVLVQPTILASIGWAEGSLETALGTVRCRWSVSGARVRVEVDVPANAEAVVMLPAAARADTVESGAPLVHGAGLRAMRDTARGLSLRLGAGSYVFEYRTAERTPDSAATAAQ